MKKNVVKMRTLSRQLRQNDLDKMLKEASSKTSKKNIKKRQYVMERSFARSVRFGYKRARWRLLWRVHIQELLTSAIQNILILIRNQGKLCIETEMLHGSTMTIRYRSFFYLQESFSIKLFND